MGSRRNLQPSHVINSIVVELLQLSKHAGNVYYDSVSQQILTLRVHNSAWKQMQCVLDLVNNDCMTGISSTVEASTKVEIFGKNVHEFSFAFVTPLRTQNDRELGI